VNKEELLILFDALTVYIRSGEFKPEQSDAIESLWHKLRWACTYPHLLTQDAADLANAPRQNGDVVEDGFGSAVSVFCPKCGGKTMQVVRPGKFQCGVCG